MCESKIAENTLTAAVKSRPRLEVADILAQYLPGYKIKKKLSEQQNEAVNAILACRTKNRGVHVYSCRECDYTEQSYNSCGNRHCPKCQGNKRLAWLKKRTSELLPVPYYHVVFTIPHLLNLLFLFNRHLCYNILFQASSGTLKAFGRDPRYLGAELGFFGILHTWGQTLVDHFHIHFVVLGGGLKTDEKGQRVWVELPRKEKFIFPTRALSKVFRGKLVALLKQAHQKGKLVFPDTQKELEDPLFFEKFIDQVVSRKWNVFAKRPFAGPKEVLSYVSRYTHRVAISNHRIVSIKKGKVTFTYKDYKDEEYKKGTNHNPQKLMTVYAEEFIRRFLLHVLPKGYHRIRMYGFMANAHRKSNLEELKLIIEAQRGGTLFDDEYIENLMKKIIDDSFSRCPACKTGEMVLTSMTTASGYIVIPVRIEMRGPPDPARKNAPHRISA